jgi:hypothetical protein
MMHAFRKRCGSRIVDRCLMNFEGTAAHGFRWAREGASALLGGGGGLCAEVVEASFAGADTMARGSVSEAPLTRQERLRRVVILCVGCLRNIAYYRAGWAGKTAGFSGELVVTVNGNFVDMAILDWCKLFGDNKEQHHWGQILTDVSKRRTFKNGLLNEIKCSRAEWSLFGEKMLAYRNKLAAHLDREREIDVPCFDNAIASTSYYHRFLLAHENDGRTYRNLPADPGDYYRSCLEEGVRVYERMQGA